MVSEASIPAEAAPYMGIPVADLLHDGDISQFLRNESSESLKAIDRHIRRCEPLLHAYLKTLGLPSDGPSWWMTKMLPAIDGELRRRNRPKPSGGGRIAEMKAALDIVEVVGRYTRLNPSGSGRMRGLCPLHQERTPSFVVYEDTQTFHCFGCGAHGDVLDSLERMGGNDR